MDDPYPAVVALMGGAASCFFSLAESALISYSPPKLLEMARRRKREGALQPFIDADERILLTCQTLSILSQIALVLGLYAWLTADIVAPDAWDRVRSGALAAVVLLTVGRLIPHFLGRVFAEEIVYGLRPVLSATHLVFGPLTFLVNGIRTFTERLAGRSSDHDGHDQILSAVEEGEMEGLIREEEADLIQRALHFRDADVADVMTPRTRMFALSVDTPISEAVEQISEVGHSRIPVHKENVDEIVGVLYAKDLLRFWQKEDARGLTVSGLAREPFFVPETKRISQLLDEFKRSRMHMAIVLDEYGGTAGIITIEDILEEIVGEIEDEYDDSQDHPLLSMIGDTEAEVDAQVHVDDLADALDVTIESDEFDTVGGLVFTALGRVPEPGDEFNYAGLHVTVLDANERSVNRVRVVRTAP